MATPAPYFLSAKRPYTAGTMVLIHALLAAALATFQPGDAFVRPIPPPMPKRAIARREGPPPGTETVIQDGDRSFTLFVPNAWKPSQDLRIAFHFHGAIWHAIQEHLDRGLEDPLVAYYPGEGSLVYQKTFEDPARLERWIGLVRAQLQTNGLPKDATLRSVDLTSFSAGFGAVREIVKSPKHLGWIRRVVLGDSLYGALDETASERRPGAGSIDPWLPLARAAAAGEKSFAITVSEVPTPYASSSECARAIVAAVGGALEKVPAGDCAATLDRDFPLRERFDRGRLHVWLYGGSDGQAHMTHARHIADVWKALDLAERAGKRR